MINKSKSIGSLGILMRLALFVMLYSSYRQLYAQEKRSHITQGVQIRGYVSDTDGVKLSNARIVCINEKGQVVKQTTSNKKGYFSMYIDKAYLNSETKLVAYFIGYLEAETRITERKELYNFYLREHIKSLNNLVVTGFVDRSKHSYIGSVSVIDKKKLQSQIKTNLINVLRREIPGFDLSENIQSGSNPNHIPELILRGRSTFIEGDRSHNPLFILDGTEVDIHTVFNLNLEDVERVTVLKDAAATTFYGAKAASGVIIITTIAPQEGRVKTRYNLNIELSNPNLSDYNLLNSHEKLEYERLAGIYGSFTGKDKTDIDRQKEYYEKLNRIHAGINTNWMKFPLRIGITHRHGLMIMGGNKQLRYSLNGAFDDIQGVMKKSNHNQSSLKIHLSYGNITTTLAQLSTWFMHAHEDNIAYNNFSDYSKLNPYDSPYLSNGTLNPSLSFGKPNPLYEQNLNSYLHKDRYQHITSFRLRTILSSFLRLEGTLSMNHTWIEQENFLSPSSHRFTHIELSRRGSFDRRYSKISDYQANLFAVYNRSFGQGDEHHLRLTLGGSIQLNKQDGFGTQSEGVLSDKISHISLSAKYAEGGRPSGFKGESRMLGAYLNAGYSYDNRYFTEGSIRYEGSSKYGVNNKFAPFTSLSLGWNIHKEYFAQDWELDLLKMRVSIGYVGNANFSPYESRISYHYNNRYTYNEKIGAVPIALVNQALQWERTLKRNFGIDFSLLSSTLNGSLDVYSNQTNDLVLSMNKPSHLGFKEAKENLGRIRNDGVELSLRGQIYNSKSININTYISISHNRNRILKISDLLQNKDLDRTSKNRLPKAIYEEGKSMTSLKVFESVGINPANGKEVFIRPGGGYSYHYDYRDMKHVGDTSPSLSGSLGMSITWKDWTLSSNFVYRLGATLYNQTLATKVEGSNPMENVDRRVFSERWKKVGDLAKYKHIASQDYTPPTSRFISKEYALEGSSLQLLYLCPNRIARLIHASQLQASLSLGNFLYLSSIKRERGLDYPFAQMYQFSISVTL